MANYYVIFQRGVTYNPSSADYTIVASADTLQEAAQKRTVSGDLVVDCHGVIVPNKSWLWSWELEDTTSYAHNAIMSYS